jgi:hypothetical protein
MSHAKLKGEQRSVGRYSPPEMRERADNQIRRLGDQIEMAQYIRGRIGMDRSMVLDMGHIPDYRARRWPPSALSRGQGNDQDSPPYSEASGDDEPVERAPKRSRTQSSSTVIGSKSFSPVTGSDQCSPVTEDESDVQVNGRHVEIKTEAQADDLLMMAKVAQELTRRQQVET